LTYSDKISVNRDRPFTKVVLAMSADGKIADRTGAAARFGSPADQRHLETQIADCDAVLFGAGTLRAYETSLPITAPDLRQQRQTQQRSPQPIHIVCSASGDLNPNLRFFQQSLPRWLLTSAAGAQPWQGQPQFDHILSMEFAPPACWQPTLQELLQLGIDRLAVLGGGELVASLVEAGQIDELYLTICPLILGGRIAPTPVAGNGFLEAIAPRLELLSVRSVEQEVFLRYRICHA
jgi:5-amino-6-(5-phosphoribosylamino)uracil reductase